VLISGAGAPAEFWPESFCRKLAGSGLRVVRYCHRDTGLSTHFDEPYEIGELLRDLLDLIGEIGNPPAHLAGHSMGGYLAQLAACRFPDAVSSVTSISAGSAVRPELYKELGMTGPSEETWRVLSENHPSGDFDRDMPGWLASWRFLNGRVKFDERMAVEYTRSLYIGDPRNAQVATNHVNAMNTVEPELVDKLRNISCPFLVIHGTEDPLVPIDNGEATSRLVPGSHFIRLEGAGHMFFNIDIWADIGKYLVTHLIGA
jgi:pimeloyl-ACP methyl ester carboxylesterase